jgi:hypothetical protein
MRRWLPRIPAAVSALFCLASICLYIRSYWVSESVMRGYATVTGLHYTTSSFEFASGRGGICLNHNSSDGMCAYQYEADTIANSGQLNRVIWYHQVFSVAASRYALSWYGPPYGHRTHFGFGGGCHVSPFRILSYGTGTHYNRAIIFPWAVPIVLFSILPLFYLRKQLKNRRLQNRLLKNLCPTCGYDLRASPILCPECGAIPTAAAS